MSSPRNSGSDHEARSKDRVGRRVDGLALLVRTATMLRPAQVAHRIRLRALRLLERRRPELVTRPLAPPASATPGWPASFTPLDHACDFGEAAEIARGTFTFLNETRELGDPPDWRQVDASLLWRFNLHYFEWAWALVQASDSRSARESFAALWQSWCSSVSHARGEAWSPYVASLRLWVMCATFASLVKGSEFEANYLQEIAWHAGYVASHLELDVGGNHLVKNIKALIGAGVFLERSDLVATGVDHLEAQLPIQVLADGGHFERSPSYHCQVLADLIDIQALLTAANSRSPRGLDAAVEAMRAWLGELVGADGDVALFNDATRVGRRRLAALNPRAPAKRPVSVLGSSGYVVVRPDDRTQVILDVGDPCPDDLPAHAHADCLSFELWIDGERAIVDTGTSTYEPGSRRQYERSTAAHNTVEIDGKDQTEVWGAFRAARRARGSLELVSTYENTVEVIASHDGYRRLAGAPLHRRYWRISPGRIEITDTISGCNTHRVVSRLHIPHIPSKSASQLSITGEGGRVDTDTCSVASRFGELHPATVHSITVEEGELPRSLSWCLKWSYHR